MAILLLFCFSGCGETANDFESVKNKGQEQLDQGNFFKATEYFHQALIFKPSDRDVIYSLGQTYKKLDMYDSAMAYFKKGRILYSHDREINKELVELCPAYGDFSGAINSIASLIASVDNEQIYWYKLAELYYYNKEPLMAIKYYKLLLDENPERASIYLKMAHTYSELGRYDEANKILNNSIAAIGPTAEVYANMGINKMIKNDYDEAEALLRKSVALDNSNNLVWINLANLLTMKENRDSDLEAYQIYKQFETGAPPGFKLDSIIPSLEIKLGIEPSSRQ